MCTPGPKGPPQWTQWPVPPWTSIDAASHGGSNGAHGARGTGKKQSRKTRWKRASACAAESAGTSSVEKGTSAATRGPFAEQLKIRSRAMCHHVSVHLNVNLTEFEAVRPYLAAFFWFEKNGRFSRFDRLSGAKPESDRMSLERPPSFIELGRAGPVGCLSRDPISPGAPPQQPRPWQQRRQPTPLRWARWVATAGRRADTIV